MAHNTEDYLERLEIAYDTGCWLMKRVPADDRRVGDAQINDEDTNELIILRRITLEEAQQLVIERTTDDTVENELLGIVILPIESKIVQAIKRQKQYGN